ncbi:response regulator [Dyella jiangningensis]|nr:response regulator [Dyella jiangningensis]
MGAVLVVDDEVTVLEATTAMLSASGYDTYPARSSADALQALARHPAIDVVVADVTLAGDDSGVLLARRLAHSAWPGALVLVSGDSEAGLHTEDRPPHSLFLAKPYSRRTLLHAIDHARQLGKQPAAAPGNPRPPGAPARQP